MTDVAAFVDLFRVPVGFLGVDLDEAAAHVGAPADIVEDEELGFRAEIGRVGDAGALQISLGALGDGARIAAIAFEGCRFDDVTTQDQRGLFHKRIHDRRVGIRHQGHVGLVDALPAGDTRAVEHLAVLENALVDHVRRHRHVLFFALGIGKSQIDELYLFVFHQFQNISDSHLWFS